MKNLIYYPNFEVKNIEWLKFALLYMEELNPIIPLSGEEHLSQFFNDIMNQTDLIRIHRPTYEESYPASLDAMDLIDKIIQNPRRYYHSFRNLDIVSEWRNPENHEYTLFQEKYTYEFGRYCLDNRFGQTCAEGVKIPSQLGYIYMSNLANIISEAKGVSAITDRPNLHNLHILLRRKVFNKEEKKIDIARSVIDLKLPKKLSHIAIEDIIEFRNKSGFKTKLKAFHKGLDNYCSSLEKPKSSLDFIKSLEFSLQDLYIELLKLSPELLNFGLGITTLYGSKDIEFLKLIGQALTFGSIGASTVKINQTWKNTQTKRFCQKYVTGLRKFPAKKVQSIIF